MDLVSWNVNGVRAWHKRGSDAWFLKEKPDIFCIQETKADETQIPEELLKLNGYSTYFESSKGRKGYSGVGIWTKVKPEEVFFDVGDPLLDQEGRLITLVFKNFVLMNCYFPNGGQGQHRIDFKLQYYEKFLKLCEKFRKKGKPVIFCGDVNTAHREIDLARPKENINNTGFLPIERAWLDKLEAKGYVDAWRSTHPDKIQYTYWDMKSFARDRNVGWRIDYFFVSKDLENKIEAVDILDEVLGSDHCPVRLRIKL